MEEFDFYIDTKVTTWYRTNFSVEAENEEEAKKKAIEFLDSDERDITPWEQEVETIEVMDVGDNDGQPTEELYDISGNMIWDNVKKD
jgi:hypothetical protein